MNKIEIASMIIVMCIMSIISVVGIKRKLARMEEPKITSLTPVWAESYDIGTENKYMTFRHIYYDKTKQMPILEDGYIRFEDME